MEKVKLVKLDEGEYEKNLEKSIQNLEDNLFADYNDNDDEEEDGVDDCLSDAGVKVEEEAILEDTKSMKFKSSDQELKYHAISVPFNLMARCNKKECKYGGGCVDRTTIGEMAHMKKDFWGELDDVCCAPSTKDRRILILEILRSAYRPNENEFQFYAGQKQCNNRIVCEAGFLILLGMINVSNASSASSQWRRCKAYVRSGDDKAGVKYNSQQDGKLKKESGSAKLFNAISFIEYFTKEFGDTIPGENGNLVLYIIINVLCMQFINILLTLL